MKKILAILLSIVCLISVMSGCTFVEEFKEGFKEGYEAAQKEHEDSLLEDEDKYDDDFDFDDIFDDVKDDEDEEDDDKKQEEQENAFEFGTVNGTTYTSNFAGFSCTLPNNWTYYSEKEIKEMNNITMEQLDEDIAEMIKKATIIYDMCAVDNATGCSVSVNFEKLPSYMSTVNMETILKGQIENTKTSLESIGAESVESKYEEVSVDGETFDALCNVAEMNGVELHQTILAFQCENYIAYVTVTATSVDGVEDILDCFSF